MSDAFRCDECGEYFDGDPAETLHEKQYREGGRSDWVQRAELCADCNADFATAVVDNQDADPREDSDE